MTTPIVTTNDCEGAGEMFSVVDAKGEPFFPKDAYLTVSGQLQAEVYLAITHRSMHKVIRKSTRLVPLSEPKLALHEDILQSFG